MFGRESTIWGIIAEQLGSNSANLIITFANAIFTSFLVVSLSIILLMILFHFLKNYTLDEDEKEPMPSKMKRVVIISFAMVLLFLIGIIIINVGESNFNDLTQKQYVNYLFIN